MLIIDWIADFRESVFFQNFIFVVPYIGAFLLTILTISFFRKIMKMPSRKQAEKMKNIYKNLPRD